MSFNLLFSLAVRGGAAFFALLMHTLVAKILVPSQAGWFYLAFTIITLTSVLCRQGFDEVVIKEIGASVYKKDFERVNSVYKTSVINIGFASIVGCFLLIAIGSVIKMYGYFIGNVLVVIAPSLIFFSMYSLHAQLLQGRFEAIKSTIVLSFVSQLSFCILIIVCPTYSAVDCAIYFNIATGLAALVGGVFWKCNKEKYIKWKKIKKINLMDSCVPIWMVAIAQQLVMWGGQFIASIFVSPVDIASYNLFMRYSIVLQFFLLFASLIYSPKISAYYASGEKEKLQNIIKKVNVSLFLVIIFTLLVCFSLGSYLINFFGSSYAKNGNVFYIVLVGQAFNTMLGFSSFILMMCNQERFLRNIVVLSLPIVLVVYFLMTYFYGIIGTSFATGLALLIQNISSIVVIRRKLLLNFW